MGLFGLTGWVGIERRRILPTRIYFVGLLVSVVVTVELNLPFYRTTCRCSNDRQCRILNQFRIRGPLWYNPFPLRRLSWQPEKGASDSWQPRHPQPLGSSLWPPDQVQDNQSGERSDPWANHAGSLALEQGDLRDSEVMRVEIDQCDAGQSTFRMGHDVFKYYSVTKPGLSWTNGGLGRANSFIKNYSRKEELDIAVGQLVMKEFMSLKIGTLQELELDGNLTGSGLYEDLVRAMWTCAFKSTCLVFVAHLTASPRSERKGLYQLEVGMLSGHAWPMLDGRSDVLGSNESATVWFQKDPLAAARVTNPSTTAQCLWVLGTLKLALPILMAVTVVHFLLVRKYLENQCGDDFGVEEEEQFHVASSSDGPSNDEFDVDERNSTFPIGPLSEQRRTSRHQEARRLKSRRERRSRASCLMAETARSRVGGEVELAQMPIR